ncbi:hypothetical protein [Halorubrum yunnanense]|uniref:Uncharacterized protein n=1 Tax=Halorubrum yunnanense TaxID=1526162 RepID=A0ABD5Y9B0_9EURY
MGIVDSTRRGGIEFGPGALTGAIGDSVTVVPLVVALATNLGVAFLLGIVAHLAWERVGENDYEL